MENEDPKKDTAKHEEPKNKKEGKPKTEKAAFLDINAAVGGGKNHYSGFESTTMPGQTGMTTNNYNTTVDNRAKITDASIAAGVAFLKDKENSQNTYKLGAKLRSISALDKNSESVLHQSWQSVPPVVIPGGPPAGIINGSSNYTGYASSPDQLTSVNLKAITGEFEKHYKGDDKIKPILGARVVAGLMTSNISTHGFKTAAATGVVIDPNTIPGSHKVTNEFAVGGGLTVGIDDAKKRPGIKLDVDLTNSKSTNIIDGGLSLFKAFHTENGSKFELSAGVKGISMNTDFDNQGSETKAFIPNVSVKATIPLGGKKDKHR